MPFKAKPAEAPTRGSPIDLEIADLVASCYADPLRFVTACYPWGEPGPLEHHDGPDTWQREHLIWIGEQVKARRFDGMSPVAPVRSVVSSGHGTGKGHPYTAQLVTPTGRCAWGDVRPGDTVFGIDGHATRVVARHELGREPVYRVTFDDRSSVLCTLNHLWNARGRQERRKGVPGWRTLSTADILAAGVKRPNGAAQSRQWEIPVQGAVQFPAAAVPIHPYVMGLWIGDGSKGEPQWFKPFPELVERVRGLGYAVSTTGKGNNRLIGQAAVFRGGVFECGSHDRYIPDAYLFNDLHARRELLRGLLDSDGEVQSSGAIGYSTTSERLIDDVIWLVRSLGGKAMRQPTPKDAYYYDADGVKVPGRTCYRATIQLDWNPFTLEHRRAAYKPSEHRYLVRWMDSIEYSHDEEAMCITVEAPDGLYQATDFIVTHNSVEVAWLVNWIMATRPHAQGTVTANTFTQLQTKTWASIQRWTKMCLIGHWFTVTSERFYHPDFKESWFCALQSSKEENSEGFAGQHAADSTSFYIFDEASAIADGIFEVAEGGLTDGEPMIFLYGNPTRSSGKFHRVAFGSERERWHGTIVDSRTSRFTNKTQIAEWVQDYGEDSDFVRVRVRGLAPAASDLQYISLATVVAAQKRATFCLPDDPLVCGLDVARGGLDNCVFRFRRGADARSIPALKVPGEQARDSMRLVSMAAEVLAKDYGGQRVRTLFVDATGIGGPIVDRLRQMGHSNVIEVQFGGESPDPKFANMRGYMWGRLRDWLSKGSIDASARLETDLTGPGYSHDKRDRILLESKDDMKKRGIDSPDDGDALALTFAYPVAPKAALPAAGPYRPRGTFL